MPLQNSDVWFITGCSTGFGRELAKLVLDRGFKAVITARDPGKIQDLVKGHEDRALALKLDVTDREEVDAAVKQAEAKFGSIDVLVNNAGFGYLGALEESEEGEVRRHGRDQLFRPRAHDPRRAPRHAAAAPRQHRQYFFDRWPRRISRRGLLQRDQIRGGRPLGVAVQRSRAARNQGAVVEPGPFRTDWAGRSLKKSSKQIPEYKETAGAFRETDYQAAAENRLATRCARDEAIIKALESEKMPLHLVLGRIALETARTKVESLRAELDAWEETSLSADYPEAQATSAAR